VDPQIQKSQTVVALNVNKSVSQSEKAVPAQKYSSFYSTSETGKVENLTPDGMTHVPESGVEFMAPISGASFCSVCQWL